MTVKPESRKRFRSAGLKDAGLINQSLPRFPSGPVRVAARLNGFSMSVTVARRTRSTARAEYLAGDCANNENRPRLIMAGAMAASAAIFSSDRRFMRQLLAKDYIIIAGVAIIALCCGPRS